MIIRIGEMHWRAKLTNHDVELIRLLLVERRLLIAMRRGLGDGQGAIEKALRESGLSFRGIGLKFDVSKSHVRAMAYGLRRA